MNQNDIKLILTIIIISLGVFVYISLSDDSGAKKAVVYYDNEEVLTVDLTDNSNRYYDVNGYNGNVRLYTSDGKIKVISENSQRHLCSKVGYISKSYESIICLPNKIVIKIEAETNIDTIVR